jgi:hypothetical protein
MKLEEESKEIEVVEKVHKTVEIPVAEFEGEYVREMIGKIPQIVMEMPMGYARHTHLKLELEVRVGRVLVDEFKSGEKKGQLYREHTLALEEIKLIGAYTADEMDPGVGGSASVEAYKQEQEEEPELEDEEKEDVGF